MRRLGIALLLIALLLGGVLRFTGLGNREMSDDEGSTWAAASAPTVEEVLALQSRLNPGKMAVHEVLLHDWIGLFGEDLAAMRALSAALGTLSILLVYWVGWELFSGPGADSSASMIAGFAAVVFAVSLVTIKYAQEARMYPVVIAATLGQVAFFIRGLRR